MIEDSTIPPVDLQTILNAIPGGHLILLPNSPTFTIIGATDTFLHNSYTTREQVVGKPVFEVFSDNTTIEEATGVANLKASLNHVIRYKEVHHLADQRYDIINPHTGAFEFKVWAATNKPVLNAEGDIQYLIHTTEDITEKVRLQQENAARIEKLDETESRFRYMVEQAPVPILLTRGDDVIIDSINAPMLKTFGKTSFDEVIGKGIVDVFPELAEQEVLQLVRNVQNTGVPFKGDEVATDLVINNESRRFYFNLSYTPIVEAGVITGVLHIALDVTHQVEARKNIEESKAELQLALEIADLGTFRLDLLTNRATSSDKVNEWFGYTEQGYSQEEGFNPIHPEDRERVDRVILNTLQSEEHSRHEVVYRVVHPTNGTVRHMRSFGKTLFNEHGKPYLIIGAIQNITAQILHQKELEESEVLLQQKVLERTVELENKNKELEQFTYAASHDMQEPLRKVATFSNYLLEQCASQIDERCKKYLGKIDLSVKRMKAIIDDLLQYSHHSRAEQQFVPTNLNTIIEDIKSDLDLAIEQKGAIIEHQQLPTVIAVPNQMHQLFFNLVTNALKFSKPNVPPKIVVGAHPATDAAFPQDVNLHVNQKYVQINVSDNGIGFNQRHAVQIFSLFKRLHGKSEYEGTGIGLALCKKIAENHRGHIWAESQPGEGTIFKILLPVE
jgi:PAS domain S-box-containing protein